MKTNRINLNFFFNSRRFPAFTVIELMIVIIIVALVGGVAVESFYVTFLSYRQTEDYIIAAEEVEYAMATLRPQFTNIGLGMPNNSEGEGYFPIMFTGPEGNHPIMGYMGARSILIPKDWGGPVTLGKGDAHNNITNNDSAYFVTERNNSGVFEGRELFYAWAVPTGVRINKQVQKYFCSENKDNDSPTREFELLEPGDAQRLRDFNVDLGRVIGLSNQNRGGNIRSWFLFPSFKIPLLLDDGYSVVDTTNNKIFASVSPYIGDHPIVADSGDTKFEGNLFGFEEVHLVQAACIFSNGDELIQRIYGEGIDSYMDITLATNVLGVYFVFDDERRILTMYTVTRGNNHGESTEVYNRAYLRTKLPDYAPDDFIISVNRNNDYRILVENMTWRIRN